MMDTNNKVAELYGKGEYRARCIRRWAKICLEGVIYLFIVLNKDELLIIIFYK